MRRPIVAAVATLALGWSLGVAAQCRTLEFAELDSLAPKALLEMRCEYFEARMQAAIASISSAGTNPRQSQAASNIGARCGEEIERIDRLLVRKLALPEDRKPGHIRAMCDARKAPAQ